MRRFFKHLKTVVRHRWYVFIYCCRCGIWWRGLIHDLSKFSPSEFIPAIRYATGKKSPIDIEIDERGYSEAWLHHKGRNKHHYEYWLDPIHMDVPCKMPKKSFVEMFCDRVGAGHAYAGKDFKHDAPLAYTKSREAKERPLMHPETYAMLVQLQEMYATKPEKEVFAYIRAWLKADE